MERFTRTVLAVPKKELEKREADYQREKAGNGQRSVRQSTRISLQRKRGPL